MKKALVVLSIVVIAVAGWFVFLSYDAAEKADEAAQAPGITVMEILHASDLQAGVKQAVATNDDAAIDEWMSQAKSVAEAASLSSQDKAYLDSQHAREYVIFNAKRQLFNEAFEARYYALKDIQGLKAQYPEANDLFPRADALLEKRDNIIRQIAVAISGDSSPSEAAIKEAQAQWLAQANARGELSSPRGELSSPRGEARDSDTRDASQGN